MKRKQAEVMLQQAHVIIASKMDIHAVITKSSHQLNYEQAVKQLFKIMIKVYKDIYE